MLLKDGRISEIGTHDELLQNNSDYAHMYNVQFEAIVSSNIRLSWNTTEISWLISSYSSISINTYLGKEINEDGIQLSGGQEQKLALARSGSPEIQLKFLD